MIKPYTDINNSDLSLNSYFVVGDGSKQRFSSGATQPYTKTAWHGIKGVVVSLVLTREGHLSAYVNGVSQG